MACSQPEKNPNFTDVELHWQPAAQQIHKDKN